MDPYVMAPTRRAYVCVLGRIWMPNVQAAQTYQLSDHDLANIESFTRGNIEEWLCVHAGDFATITDFYAVVGSEEIGWASEENACTFDDLTYGYEEES